MKFRREELEISDGRRLYLYHFQDAAETHERQAGFWSSVSDNWHGSRDMVERWFGPVTKAMLERLGPGPGRLLDLGCGAQSMPLPGGWDVVGVDVTRPMLRPESRVLVGSCNPLALRSGAFDAAVSRFALMFAADAGEAIGEAERVLNSCGRLVFSVWGPAEQNLWSEIPSEVLSRRLGIRPPEPDEPHAFRLAGLDETKDLLTAAGFEADEPESVIVPYMADLDCHGALEAMLTLAGPLRTAVARLPEAERAETLEEIEGRYANADMTGHAFVWSAKKRS
ncbi:MAG: methyltransferase domain-containing protein [Armatimonadetes bacterium]|nr:methyltransferase domain-containing protein [Armatimonadota bacterium]